MKIRKNFLAVCLFLLRTTENPQSSIISESGSNILHVQCSYSPNYRQQCRASERILSVFSHCFGRVARRKRLYEYRATLSLLLLLLDIIADFYLLSIDIIWLLLYCIVLLFILLVTYVFFAIKTSIIVCHWSVIGRQLVTSLAWPMTAPRTQPTVAERALTSYKALLPVVYPTRRISFKTATLRLRTTAAGKEFHVSTIRFEKNW